jgi:hypothetical protein
MKSLYIALISTTLFFSTNVSASMIDKAISSPDIFEDRINLRCGNGNHYLRQFKKYKSNSKAFQVKFIPSENFDLLISKNCQDELDNLLVLSQKVREYLEKNPKHIDKSKDFIKLYKKARLFKDSFNVISDYVSN